jgi:Mce-associated membrane protein
MDDSQTAPEPEAPAAEAASPTPPRPRGKHRLPPRRAMQAAAAQASGEIKGDAQAADGAAPEVEAPADQPPVVEPAAGAPQPAEPAEAAEVSPDEPAETSEFAATEVVPAETKTTDAGTPPPARRWKWFRRRPPQASAAASGDAVTNVADQSADQPAPEQPESADQPAPEQPQSADQPAPEQPQSADQPALEGEAEAEDAESSAEAGDELPLAERKPVSRPLVIAVAAASAVFVAAGGFAGAMLQPYLADRALIDTKLDIARTAANAIATLWTYTPDDMDKLPDRAARYLSGGFETEYRKYVDGIAAANKQAQVSDSTQVMAAAVESLDGLNATALVYTNTTTTSPLTKNVPSLQYLSYRLTMQRKDSRWLITHMTTITSANLTPKFG